MANGEIACFEQFLLLSLCFQKAVSCRSRRQKASIRGRGLKGVKIFMNDSKCYYWIEMKTFRQKQYLLMMNVFGFLALLAKGQKGLCRGDSSVRASVR